MRRLVVNLIVAPLALLASACQPGGSSVEPSHQPRMVRSASLLGTWELLSVDDIAVPSKRVSVTFGSDGRFTAKVDCNTARGTYSFSSAELSFHGWEVTEMGCVPPLPQEALIGEALRGDGYAVAFTNSSELHLSGPPRLVLRRL